MVSGAAASNVARRSAAVGVSKAAGEDRPRDVRLVALPGVFRPRSDSWQLARAACAEPLPRGAEVLELCAGTGLAAIMAARAHGGRATTVDVSRRAQLTAWLNGLFNAVRVSARRGDLFEPVAGETFDLIVSNPPYVPAAGDELPRRGPERGWEAGRNGRAFLDRICAEAPAHLRPGGAVLAIHSEIVDADATLRAFAAAGLEADVAVRHPGPLGPLMRERAGLLEARGLLAPGRREEDVLVLRGRAPRRWRPAAESAPRRMSGAQARGASSGASAAA
jgi:release factor glutamine methyltransferase